MKDAPTQPAWLEKTHRLIQTALDKARRPAVLCSYGKDSIVLLDLIREHIPLERLRIIHVDTTFEFPELYAHKQRIIEMFGIGQGDVTVRNDAALARGMSYENTPVIEMTTQLKTVPLKETIAREGVDFLFTGIRRDEEGSRAKERYFSYRDAQGVYEPSDNKPEFHPLEGANITSPAAGHYRVNALLDWTELDIWQYTRERELPLCPLYLAQGGKRYRSLGCMPVTTPVESDADTIEKIIGEVAVTLVPERASRARQDGAAPHCMEMLRRNGFC